MKDTAKHVILGTQQFKPTEFAAQINLNMDNAWGILRCIVDTCMKLKEGKYLIMKDPNKVSALGICRQGNSPQIRYFQGKSNYFRGGENFRGKEEKNQICFFLSKIFISEPI